MKPPGWSIVLTASHTVTVMEMRTVGVLLSLTLGVTLLAVGPAPGVEAAGDTAAPTRLQLATDAHRVGPNGRVTLASRLLGDPSGEPVVGEDVLLQYQRIGRTGWRDSNTLSTDQDGRAEFSVRLTSSTRFRAVHRESPTAAASTSQVRRVYVKPVVSASLGRDWVRPGGSVRLNGRVRPAYVGERVTLQRRTDGQWRSVSRVQQGDDGRFTFTIRGTATYGPQVYRVALEARDRHLAATSSRLTLTTVRLVTYSIETRGKVKGALDSFKRRTAEIYADRRGWSRSYIHFSRVRSGGAFSLVLSAARYVPTFAPICSSYYSCRVGRYVVINEDRWRAGTPYFKKSGGTLRMYRAMVVNHETGHWLGLGHASCGGSGQPAPVMQQQSKGLYGCEPNAWPLPWEVRRAR
jgi:5-hydroxyisourate hydrolase-like protein (transthyretin family)